VTADYVCSGVVQFPGGTMAWSGKDHLKNNINGDENPRGFIASMKFDPEKKQALLTLSGSFNDGLIQTLSDLNGKSTTQTFSVIYGLDKFDGEDKVYPSNAVINLDSSFNIPKGSSTAKTVQTSYNIYGTTDTVKIEWNTIQCESPPKEDTARSVALPSGRVPRR
jgi:hypothetical protein